MPYIAKQQDNHLAVKVGVALVYLNNFSKLLNIVKGSDLIEVFMGDHLSQYWITGVRPVQYCDNRISLDEWEMVNAIPNTLAEL